MSAVQNFEYGVSHDEAAAQIMQLIGYKVCEGMSAASWVVPEIGGICMLHHYEQRNRIVDGELITEPTPFYLLHATTNVDGKDAVIVVDFGADIPSMRRNTQQAEGQIQTDLPWDTAQSRFAQCMQAGHDFALTKHTPKQSILQVV
ncbi:hypothetical protein KDA23_03695 [Candidatus Saccharibacteria bacterium]|nr:hypothetical protein [Candidatus Saccharibacteria bacterium]